MDGITLLSLIAGKTKSVLIRSPLQPFLKNCSLILNPGVSSRFKLIKKYAVNIVLDVGAHIGEYGVDLRFYGYSNKIISFEPMKTAFLRLQKKSRQYSNWECLNYALGDKEEAKNIHVLQNSSASSFLEASNFFSDNFRDNSKKRNEETVQVKTLDQVYSQLCKPSDSVFLKIDVQGFEKQILEGAQNCLQCISIVQLETSLVPLYQNEPLISEMIYFMRSKGFVPVLVEPHPFDERMMRQIQADVLFLNIRHLA